MIKNKEFIYEYWGKTELGCRMIESDNVSDLDLLFLIPNNVKKRYGLPLTRISGKKKRKQKHQRKRSILSFELFDIIEEIIEETIRSKWSDNELFGEFVEIKNLNIGDKSIFFGKYDEILGKDYMRRIQYETK
jgi:hypothetical protein